MREKLQIPIGMDGLAFLLPRLVRKPFSHRHDELEVNLVVSGRASYLFENRRVSLAAHSMIWLFPKQEHMLVEGTPDFSMWVLVFDARLTRRLSGAKSSRVLRQSDPGDVFCRRIDSQRVELLRQIYQDVIADSEPALKNAALAYALLASWRAYESAMEPQARTDVHPAVARAARLIADADEPVALDELARVVGLSAARLSRLFKLQTGAGLTAFRQRKCLERFLHRFGRGARYTVTEAALAAGFGSYAQFHRVFRHNMRMSPATYRRQFRDEEAA